jgi:hypothetical protein
LSHSAREAEAGVSGRRREPNAVLLPVGMLATFGIGVALMVRLVSPGSSGWLQLSVGASLCVIAGWMASAFWSRVYWNRSVARQVATWRRITDAFFAWVEGLEVSTEALNDLKVSLEEAVPAETA